MGHSCSVTQVKTSGLHGATALRPSCPDEATHPKGFMLPPHHGCSSLGERPVQRDGAAVGWSGSRDGAPGRRSTTTLDPAPVGGWANVHAPALQSQLRPKKRSKKSPSFWSTVRFLAEWPPAFAKRETGGRIRVIAVPVGWTAPSRRAASTKAWVASRSRPSLISSFGSATGRGRIGLAGWRWRQLTTSCSSIRTSLQRGCDESTSRRQLQRDRAGLEEEEATPSPWGRRRTPTWNAATRCERAHLSGTAQTSLSAQG